MKQWNTASRFALAMGGSASGNDRPTWSDYWRNFLGRSHGSTFLMECVPYPRATRSTPLPAFPGLTEDDMWKRRLPILRQHVQRVGVKFVIAYGKATKQKASEIFMLKSDAWRAVSGVSRNVEIATNGETCVAHAGFFGRGLFANDDILGIVRALQDRGGAT